jgi:hypothetical protein
MLTEALPPEMKPPQDPILLVYLHHFADRSQYRKGVTKVQVKHFKPRKIFESMARAIQPAADQLIFESARSFKFAPMYAGIRTGSAAEMPVNEADFRKFNLQDCPSQSIGRQAAERLTDIYNELPLKANIRQWARSQARQVYRDWVTVRRIPFDRRQATRYALVEAIITSPPYIYRGYTTSRLINAGVPLVSIYKGLIQGYPKINVI